MSAKAWVSLVCQLAVALVLAPSAPAAEPSDLESELTMSIGGVEQTLTLQEAMDRLNIPSVSLALIGTGLPSPAPMARVSRRRRSTRRRHCRNSWRRSAPCVSSRPDRSHSTKTSTTR